MYVHNCFFAAIKFRDFNQFAKKSLIKWGAKYSGFTVYKKMTSDDQPINYQYTSTITTVISFTNGCFDLTE